MDLEDAGTRVKFVLHDRDASFTAAFDAVFQAAGVRIVRSAVQLVFPSFSGRDGALDLRRERSGCVRPMRLRWRGRQVCG
jgi:hypothetical protein